MTKVAFVNSSENRGANKCPFGQGFFKEVYRLEGDGYRANWNRQVSIFDVSSLNQLNQEERKACEATYSENLTTDGTVIHNLPIGTRLQIRKLCFM
ncbi:MAG: hypothetical protein JW702_05955 [Clostridiales bacterium]|nr:hypothetical protein [Clostridiales bacterium]